MLLHSLRASEGFTTFVVSVAIFTDILLQNLILPALPYALHSRIGLENEADIQRWTSILSSAFGGAFMVGSLLFGYLGDVLSSRRTIFIFGLLVIFLSTLSFALATRLWVLLTARLLQGISTSVVTTVGYVLLTDVVAPERLGKAMGYTTMALSMALMLGPVLGGFLYEYCGYSAVFYPVFGLFALELVLRLLVVEGAKGEEQASTTPPTGDPSRVVSTDDNPASNDDENDGRPESQPLINSAAETNPPPHPLQVYTTLLSSPRFLVALLGLFIQNSIACGFDSTLAPHLRDTFAFHASTASLLFLTLAAPMLLAPLLGSLTDRFGPKVITSIGLALAVPAYILLSFITRDVLSPLPKMVGSLVLLGFAWAFAMPPLRVEVGLVVKLMGEEEPGRFGRKGGMGRAFGLVNLVVAAAGLLGPLYSGFVRIGAGWRVLLCVNAGASVLLLVLVVLVTGSKLKQVEQKGEAVV